MHHNDMNAGSCTVAEALQSVSPCSSCFRPDEKTVKGHVVLTLADCRILEPTLQVTWL